ncbi:3-carboxy-cis,cis-muconate cycloisomerase [Micromonospora sp. M51]|uniref:lyase family protein n=1 Tax=Micromonospora sp. M51 TaxID=2824889 RepID=UPI001B386619|nr:lyase family protein [Micromonospora sp. M51]MBQ1009457.1 3-carboxy-cis,cis-muconate cycloisomerase [Micromonospora sp. M51]
MRPSSSPSDGLLGGLSGTSDVDAELSDPAVLQAMLDAEAALARAVADAGIMPAPAADAIVAQCRAERYDPGALGRAADATGNPVVPLVGELTAAVPEHHRAWVHFGATSQDVLDTFGLKDAGWLTGQAEARDRLRQAGVAQPAQLGGAVGTLAAYGPAGADVAERFAAHLGLPPSPLPWHTRRQPWLDLATALGGLLVAAGKVALDVGLLAQNEIAEVAEGGVGRGGSSAMPHKRNPVDSVLVTAATRRGPGLVATVFAAAVQEHERAAGAWHAEWEPLLDLLHVTGGAAARCARMLVGLRVDARRMRANLDATGGVLLAEAVAARLTPAVGRRAAHDLVTRAAAAPSFRAALLADTEIRAHLSDTEIAEALDPHRWLGSAGRFVDRALVAVRGADG